MGLKDRAMEMASKAAEKAKEAGQDALERRAEKKDAEAEPATGGDVVFVGTSHDEGRNAKVTLYRDRIERVKERSRTSLSRAQQDTEVTPVRAVSSVQATKDGRKTKVTVYATGNNIEFRFDHGEAQQFKDALTRLIV